MKWSNLILMVVSLTVCEEGLVPVHAAPHGNSMRRTSHHRTVLKNLLQRSGGTIVEPESKRQECEYGSWRCMGNELQRCYGGTFGTLRTCTADQVCSTDNGETGCIWAWQKPGAASESKVVASTTPDISVPTTIEPSKSSVDVVKASTLTTSSATVSASSWSKNDTQAVTPTPTWIEPSHTESHNLSTLVPTPTSTPLPDLGNAHYVIYSDAWLTEMPQTSAVQGFNKFILAFWLSDRGAADNATFWEKLSQGEQLEVVKRYEEAGITLMVSAFGATDNPITNGKEPIALARTIAEWVKKNNMAGVDIDLEDAQAMNKNVAIDWIVTFQKELRRQLPRPYIISHAPQAPWFTSASKWGGGYTRVDQECGDGIDFYNVQFYNQGSDQYHLCQNLLFDSGPQYPNTSVFQTHKVGGIPLNKLVIGKPLSPNGAANGYMEPGLLKDCVAQAKKKGWDAGVMYWEYDKTAPGTLLAVMT